MDEGYSSETGLVTVGKRWRFCQGNLQGWTVLLLCYAMQCYEYFRPLLVMPV